MTTPAAPSTVHWRLAPLIAGFLAEANLAWPLRSTTHDGTIGDARHQARQSDHNPDAYGYVRAVDITADLHNGPPMDELAELLRRVGEKRSDRLTPGGYVVWNRRIASSRSRWRWITYMGGSPHTDHLHLSVAWRPDHYKITQPWNLARLRPQ